MWIPATFDRDAGAKMRYESYHGLNNVIFVIILDNGEFGDYVRRIGRLALGRELINPQETAQCIDYCSALRPGTRSGFTG